LALGEVSSAFASAVLAASLTLAVSLEPARPRQQSAPPANANAATADFTGEVSLGKSYQHDIGHGLIFALAPTPGDSDAGWNIQIFSSTSPSSEPALGSDNPVDFASIATPPYHGENPLYLDTTYSTKAEDAVADTPRKFYFIESPADFKAAENAVNLTVYHNNASTKQINDAKAAAAKVRVGSGELAILDSHIVRSSSDRDLGSIQWIKFRVQLKFDTDMTMAKILDSAGQGGK
jgi:hypothetical protein